MLLKKKYNYHKQPNLTYFLISGCISIFILQVIFYYLYGSFSLQSIFSNYGFSLQNILDGKYYTFVTSLFLHANPGHLILNMIALYFFGKAIEEELGWKTLLMIFLLGGIIGNVFVLIASFLGIMSPVIVTVGASGAIFALLGAAIFVKPLEFVFFPYIVPVPLILVALIYIIFNITEFIAYLSSTSSSGIAYIAHIGGLIFGIIYGFKIEGEKKSLIILLILLGLLIITPFIWNYLQVMDYSKILSSAFK